MTTRDPSHSTVSVIRVEGSLLAPLDHELLRRVEALLVRGRRSILLDLADVTDLDAAGVGELVRAYTLATAGEAELWVENAIDRVRMLLDRAGLLEVLAGESAVTYENAREAEAAEVGCTSLRYGPRDGSV
jgi:anti-anti-sigma factor